MRPRPTPFGRGHPRWIRCIQSYHAVGGAHGTTMVGGDVCGLVVLGVDGTFPTIPTARILRGGSFLFPPEPL